MASNEQRENLPPQSDTLPGSQISRRHAIGLFLTAISGGVLATACGPLDPILQRLGGINPQSEFGNSLISMDLYRTYTGLAAAYSQAERVYGAAMETVDEARRKWADLKNTDDAASSTVKAAYADMERKDKTALSKLPVINETYRNLIPSMRDISTYLIHKHWSELSIPERRIVDVVASDYQLYTPLVQNVIDGLISGNRIVDEVKMVKDTITDTGVGYPGSGGIYGRSEYADRKTFDPDSAHVFGSMSFGVQRVYSHLIPDLLPRFLKHIPEGNTINRSAVNSYLKEIGKGRAQTLDGVDIEFALNPHLKQPYTDQEWVEQIEKQLTVAPKIAATLVEENPTLAAVTMYGPITRADQNYFMFHPHNGLRLGAYFYMKHPEKIQKAAEMAHELGKRYGVEIRTGTNYGGMLGVRVSTWDVSTLYDIQKMLGKLDDRISKSFVGKMENYVDNTSIEWMQELTAQLLEGTPLAVSRQRSFDEALDRLERFRNDYSNPIFERVPFLFRHFEAGYPYPVEYKGSYNH